jgi:hypothetical protein
MTFLTWPLAAAAAGVLIPTLVILYFLKLRRRDVEVSSTLLWKKAIQDLQANAPFQKLRNNILLILQLLVLIAALLAIAQPEFKDTSLVGQRQIILIDRSASMSSTDGAAADGAAATDGRPGATRLDEAKRRARAMVDALKEPTLFDETAQEAMIIAFDSSAEVRQVFTSSKALLRAAIDGIEPTDAPSGLTKAVELARAYTGTRKFEDQIVEGGVDPATGQRRAIGFVASGPGATLHVFSDGRLPDAEKVQKAPEDRVEFHSVGRAETVNVGITGLRAERSFDTPARVNIFVAVQSTDQRPRSVDVELLVDGVVQRVSGVQITGATPGQGGEGNADADVTQRRGVPGIGGFVLPLDRPEAGSAQVRLLVDEQDALGVDNTAYVIIPPVRRLNVALVTSGSLFVERALRGLNLSKLDVLTPAQFQTILDGNKTTQYDVMVFDRVLPLVEQEEAAPVAAPAASGGTGGAAGAAAPAAGVPGVGRRRPGLPPGRSLVLGAVPPPPLGAIDRGPGEASVIYDFVREHPALRLAGLEKVNIARSRKVEVLPDTPVRVIARDAGGGGDGGGGGGGGGGGPAILEVSDASTNALIVTFDPSETDWPFAAEWVLFLAGSVLHLSEAQTGAISEGVRAGDTLATRLPLDAERVELVTPAGDRLPLEPAADGTVSYGPVRSTGIYRIGWDGLGTSVDLAEGDRATRRIAANLLDPFESDVGASPALPIASEILESRADQQGLVVRRLWPWLLLGALGVLMLEWFIYNRKVAI